MTNNPGNKLALAAASVAARRLAWCDPGASGQYGHDKYANQGRDDEQSGHQARSASTQIKGETRGNFIKMKSYSNQQKCQPMTAEWIKLHPAEAKQVKIDCAAQSNQIKLNQSNQIKLNTDAGDGRRATRSRARRRTSAFAPRSAAGPA